MSSVQSHVVCSRHSPRDVRLANADEVRRWVIGQAAILLLAVEAVLLRSIVAVVEPSVPEVITSCAMINEATRAAPRATAMCERAMHAMRCVWCGRMCAEESRSPLWRQEEVLVRY